MRHQNLAVIALSALATGSAAYPTSDYEDLDLYTREASLEDFENPVFHARDADPKNANPEVVGPGSGRGFGRSSAFKSRQGDHLTSYDHQLLKNVEQARSNNGAQMQARGVAQDAQNLVSELSPKKLLSSADGKTMERDARKLASHLSPEQLQLLKTKLFGPAGGKVRPRSDMDNEQFLATREADYGDESFLWNQNERRTNILEQGLNKLGIHSHAGSDSVGKGASASSGNFQENIMYNGQVVKPGHRHYSSESREAKQAMGGAQKQARSWIDDDEQLLSLRNAEAEAEADPRFLSKVFKGGLGLPKGSMSDESSYERRDADADAWEDDENQLLALREADAYAEAEAEADADAEPIIGKILRGAMELNRMRHQFSHGGGHGGGESSGGSSIGYGEGGYERRDAYADADADAEADYFEDPDLW